MAYCHDCMAGISFMETEEILIGLARLVRWISRLTDLIDG
jgi:hypothetical protein